jgi:hypothetical protein
MAESPYESYRVVALKQKFKSDCLESRGGRPLYDVEAIFSKLIHKQRYGENENFETYQD